MRSQVRSHKTSFRSAAEQDEEPRSEDPHEDLLSKKLSVK
jgi:hypothetical protein